MDANDKKTAPAPAMTAAPAPTVEPVKKRGSTKATRRARDVEKRVSKSMDRISEAAKKGVDDYMKRRDKSDTKRKDGALLDLPENVIRSASKAAAKATPLVGDLMKLISTKDTRKAMRRNFRNVPSVPFM